MALKRNFFDWSKLEREFLAEQILQLRSQICGIELTVNQIHKILSNKIKSILPVFICKSFDKDVDSGVVYLGGLYYSDLDHSKKQCIEINFVYKNKEETYLLCSRRLKKLAYCFADTVLHEIIHMRQFRRRKFKSLPDYASTAEKTSQRQEQSYLGNSDEIDAYGFNIACELITKFKSNNKKIIKYLNENQLHKKRKLNCWRMYLKAFDHDHNHKIIRRLKKKVIRYLPHAEIGKPYNNKDWIG